MYLRLNLGWETASGGGDVDPMETMSILVTQGIIKPVIVKLFFPETIAVQQFCEHNDSEAVNAQHALRPLNRHAPTIMHYGKKSRIFYSRGGQ